MLTLPTPEEKLQASEEDKKSSEKASVNTDISSSRGAGQLGIKFFC